MQQSSVISLLTTLNTGGKSESSGGKDAGGTDFLDMVRSFLTGGLEAQGADNTSTQFEKIEISPRQQEILGRIRELVDRGDLDRSQVESMDSDEFAEVEEWAAAGAGGVFQPLPQDNTVAEEDAVAGVDGVEPVDLLEMLKAMLAAEEENATQVSAAPVSDMMKNLAASLAQLAGVENITAGDLEKLASVLTEKLAGLQAGGGMTANLPLAEDLVPEAVTKIFEMPAAELAGVVAEALDEAGIAPEGISLEEIPAPILRTLAVKVVAVSAGEEMPDASLWQKLAGDGALKEQLVAAQPVAELANDMVAVSGKTEIEPVATGEKTAVVEEFAAEMPVTIIEQESGVEKQVKPQVVKEEEKDSEHDSVSGNELAVDAELGGEMKIGERAPVEAIGGDDADLNIAATAKAESRPEASQNAQAQYNNEARAAVMNENIERISQMMSASRSNGLKQITVQLSPPELGNVTVRMEVRNGSVSAVLHTQNIEARDILSSGLEHLRQTLQVQGVELRGFDVSLGAGDASQNGTGQGKRKHRNPASQGETQAIGAAVEEENAAYRGNGALNVIV